MAYIQGESRSQTSLFPVALEELIPEDHLVRGIDLYAAKLDLGLIGFEKAQPKAAGRPAYYPADHLKLYLYGYFQRMAIVRARRSVLMIEVMCSSLISVTGFSPMTGKMWLRSAPRNPAMDLLTKSGNLKFIHSSAT